MLVAKLWNVTQLHIASNLNLFFIKRFCGRVIFFYLPSYFFFSTRCSQLVGIFHLKLLFLKRFFFISFLAHFFNYYKQLFSIFFVKIKIRGLGYRIRRISLTTFSFFFIYTNYYYFFLPHQVLAKQYRKRLLLLAVD